MADENMSPNEAGGNPLVEVKDGKVIATSLRVAEVFGKRHNDVLRSISRLGCSDEFNQRNFARVEYLDAKGESRPMVEMTRDGWAFLVMGFTGAEAAAWKEQYIAQFNAMEGALRSVGIPADLSTEIAALRADVRALMGQVRQPGTALVTTHASANEIAIERGAKQKGRHGLTVRIGNFLELACRDAGEQVLPGRGGKRMFPRSIMMGHVLDYVDALVADHNRALDAQGDLLGTGRRRALAKVAVADTIIGAAREGLAALVFGGELIFFDTTADDVEEGAEVVAVLNTSIGGAGRFVPCIAGERQPGYGPLARPVHGPHVRSAFPLIYRVAGPIVGRQPLHKAA